MHCKKSWYVYFIKWFFLINLVKISIANLHSEWSVTTSNPLIDRKHVAILNLLNNHTLNPQKWFHAFCWIWPSGFYLPTLCSWEKINKNNYKDLFYHISVWATLLKIYSFRDIFWKILLKTQASFLID